MRAQRQATWQRWSLAAFQLAHSCYACLICQAARMLRRVGCIQKFTNLLRTFRISSLHPASGYLTPIGVDAGGLRGRQRDENETRKNRATLPPHRVSRAFLGTNATAQSAEPTCATWRRSWTTRVSTTARYTHIDSERLARSSETSGFTAVTFMRVRAIRRNAARPGTQRMPSSWKKLRSAFR
jgi:hypothetical protein